MESMSIDRVLNEVIAKRLTLDDLFRKIIEVAWQGIPADDMAQTFEDYMAPIVLSAQREQRKLTDEEYKIIDDLLEK